MLLDGYTAFIAWFAVICDAGLPEHHTVSLRMRC